MWRVFIAMTLVSACAVHAQELPEVQSKYGVKYVSGGMSPDERKEMAAIGRKFPIHLHFVIEGRDTPISGVKVTARDVKGDVYLQAQSDGPLFFFEATGGRYTIEAEYNGEKLSQTKDLVGRRYLLLEYRFHSGS